MCFKLYVLKKQVKYTASFWSLFPKSLGLSENWLCTCNNIYLYSIAWLINAGEGGYLTKRKASVQEIKSSPGMDGWMCSKCIWSGGLLSDGFISIDELDVSFGLHSKTLYSRWLQSGYWVVFECCLQYCKRHNWLSL